MNLESAVTLRDQYQHLIGQRAKNLDANIYDVIVVPADGLERFLTQYRDDLKDISCVMAVRQEFEKVGLRPFAVNMGEVKLAESLFEDQVKEINERLTALGFEILNDKNHKLIEKIKTLLINQVQSGEVEEHFSLSEFVSKSLNREYSQISRLFSEVEGMTLEQFFILQKVEKVKEWLTYDELTLSEISWKLGYSSVAHLSAQFKKITGLTPSEFKKIGISHRKPLDEVKKRK